MKVILCMVLHEPGGDIFTAIETYATHPSDTPPNQLFIGRLVAPNYERAVSFQQWQRSSTAAPISVIEHVNREGAIDSWWGMNWKDVRGDLAIVEPRAAWSTKIEVGSVTIERLETGGQTRTRLICRSAIEHLAKPITRTYPQTVFNEQLRGQCRPLVLGRVRWADPRPQRLQGAAATFRGLYDVTDDVFEGIVEVRHRGLAQSANVSTALTGGGYFEDQTECFGFRFGSQPNRLAAEVRGNVRRAASLTVDGAFAADLSSWEANTHGGSSIAWVSAGVVDMVGDNDLCQLRQIHDSLTVGGLYQLAVEIDNTTNTGVDLMYGETVLRTVEGIVLRTIVVSFVATVGGATVGLEIPTSRSSSCRVLSINVYPIARIDSLSEVLRFCASRAGLSDADIDLAACAAIEAESPYRLAFATTVPINGDVLAKRAALSYGCGLFQDRFGKIKPVRLKAPAALADFEIFERQVLDIRIEDDTAPGLATRMNYGQNHVQHSNDDMSGLADTALRAELAIGVRIVTSTVTPHAFYSEAAERPPLDSILSEQADAQAEINRLNTLYQVKRFFVPLRVRTDDSTDPYLIEPGHTVKVWHHRFEFAESVNLYIFFANSKFSAGAVDLWGWGTYEVEPDPAPGSLAHAAEELIQSPDIDSTDGWYADWLFEDGYAQYDGVTMSGTLEAALLRSTTTGASYRLSVDILACTPGGFTFDVTLHGDLIHTFVTTTPGHYSVDLIGVGNARSDLFFTFPGGVEITFDRISFVELN